MKTMLFILSLVFAGAVAAAGGQNRIQNPVIDEDGCLLIIPGIDCEDAGTVSGVEIEECTFDGNVMRLCPTDD